MGDQIFCCFFGLAKWLVEGESYRWFSSWSADRAEWQAKHERQHEQLKIRNHTHFNQPRSSLVWFGQVVLAGSGGGGGGGSACVVGVVEEEVATKSRS